MMRDVKKKMETVSTCLQPGQYMDIPDLMAALANDG